MNLIYEGSPLMTAPIDLECSTCKAGAGNYCTAATEPNVRVTLLFHHAERVDAAARESEHRRRGNPDRLRQALRRALDGWDYRDHDDDDAAERDALRVEFDLP